MSTGFVAKGGTSFDQISGWHVDEDGTKYLKVDAAKWEQIQRLLAYYDCLRKSDDNKRRARGNEGRYATERAVYIITEGWCHR